jgi:HPt (histidine-containing phosphotransfer) domain-containing protein
VSPDPTAILDLAALERQTGGDASLRREIVRMFLEDCPMRVDAIGAALASGDIPMLVSSAHTLKGSAAYLKASIVRDHAAEIERCAREGRTSEATAEFDRLRVAIGQLLPELRKLDG